MIRSRADKIFQMGITIIMVEHKMEKLASYCDKILLLHDGKQIAYDTPEKIFSTARMIVRLRTTPTPATAD